MEIEGGIQPYSIVWSDMSTGLVRTGQMPGTEYFTITDGNNCIIIDSSEIIQRSSFDVSSIANDILCFTDTVGTANVTATNGSAPYSFIWDNGEIGPNPVMLHAGVNTVTITDNGNCEVIHQVNINSPPKITIDFSPTAPSCIGSDDGSLSIDIEGGVGAPYAINWFNGNDTELVNNLESGDFCVTVSDATGCEETSCYFLDNPQRITVQESITSVNCSGNCSGAIQLETFGGSGNFNFEWSGPNNYSSMDQNISDLCPGNYIVTVSEILNPNCSETFSYVINMESELEAFIQTNRFISCFGGADGILIGIPFGGVPDYTYTWSSNVTSSNGNAAQNLSAGIYELTITDANGCESIAIDTLTQPDSLTLSFTNVDIVCYGESTGSSRVAIEGGTPDYIINWQNGETSTSIVNVPSQSYSITVTDRLGCTTVDETLVNEPPDSIMINAQIEGVTCFEGSDGRINVFTENTAEPVMYSIDNINFKFDRTFIGLSAGVYTIYVIDDNGCSQEMDINVEESLPLDLDLGEDLVVFFGEEANLNVAVNNNSNDLSYVWNSPNDSVTFSCQDCPNPIVSNITSSFTANVLVTDENGCTGREVINVFVDQEDQIDVPTIFTPNNDNINDRLNIFGSPDIRGVNFKVYSRWGELLFESTDFVPNDPLNGWDGTVNGSPASSGTYTWTAEYILENNDRAFKSGQTYLQR